jgi:cytochrome P450
VTTIARFDPFTPEAIADPYPHYRRLRDEAPVCWLPDLNAWFVARYDDVATVVHDPATFSSAAGMGALMTGRVGRRRIDAREAFGIDLTQLRVLIASDPPEHTRLRRLLSRAFTPKTISDLEPHLRTVCEGLVDNMVDAARHGEADLVHHIAEPFPVIVIAELLGIPTDRRLDFKRWSNALVGTLAGGANPDEMMPALLEMFTFIAAAVDERTRTPGTDMISLLVNGSDPTDPDALSPIEIALFAILLLVAGNETTTNLIGNGFAALAAHPEQARRLYDDPTLLPGVVEEVLRWDSPVQGLFRATTRPVTLGDTALPQGDTLLISFASANRDESHFVDGDRFDINRNPIDHLAFGHGIHHCLGAALARLEARIVGETLLDRGLHLRPGGEPQRAASPILRGFTRLPVTITRRANA